MDRLRCLIHEHNAPIEIELMGDGIHDIDKSPHHASSKLGTIKIYCTINSETRSCIQVRDC
jgi:hypothetical protein